MPRLHTSHDTTLLSACVFPSGDARALPDMFRAVIDSLAHHDVNYAVAGRLGRGRYCRAQWTDIIELRVEASATPDLALVIDAVAEASRPAGSTVRIELQPTTHEPEMRFLHQAKAAMWLGTEARMASAEHLLWLALRPGTLAGRVDAIDLIQSGHIDREAFGREIGQDPAVRARLARATSQAKLLENSSYSASVARRLAERALRPLMAGPRDD